MSPAIPGVKTRPRDISSCELEVLTLVPRGGSNKIVGHDLRISEATVKTHLRFNRERALSVISSI